MRPGDLIAFKEGLFGIKAPHNLAIFLERRKRKKEFLLVVHTVKGRRDIKPEQVAGRKFTANVDPGLDEEAMTARLKDLVKEAEGGALDQRQGTEADLDERKVWERLVNEVEAPETVERLAERMAEGGGATKADVRRMQKLLDRCRRTGVGFFERHERATWAPIPVATFKGFLAVMERLNVLRKKLIVLETVEDDSGEPWETWRGVRPDEADLDAEEEALLAAVADAMRRFVEEDRWPDDVTPPGVGVHTLVGQSYHRFIDWFARDWTTVRGVTLSSAMVQFLVDAGLETTQDAIRLIARRRVHASDGFTWKTPEDIENWAERYEEPAAAAEKDPALYAHREDLRGLETYTIDPPDAKDFDDAVSLVPRDDGGATLWVHIADVSHYVEKDSRLDHHARERATSVYLPTGVLPMLPARLSDDLCSLREEVDRFAMSVALDIDPDGRVTGARPTESVIRVDRNMHYDQVLEKIEAGDNVFAELRALADRMDAHRRGLAIETGELRIRFAEEEAAVLARMEGLAEDGRGEEGAPAEAGDAADTATPTGDAPPADAMDPGLSIQIKYASPATKLIETFMVAANEAVSRFVADHEVPVPYRCHPLPDRNKVERLVGQAHTLGLDLTFDLPDVDRGDDDAEVDAKADEGPSILDQLQSGKLQLGGFAASETIGSKAEEEEVEDEDEAAADLRPSFTGLAQLSEADQEAWLAPFREALRKVNAIEDDRMRELASMKVLQTLGRALYTPRNLGHFGLGSVSYAHFTSPIRRYPDLVLHRQLRWVLRKARGLDVPEDPPHAAEHLDTLCDTCTAQAEAAERLERGLKDCCMVFESRREEWSKRLQGMVNGITPGGLFLSLPGELEARLPSHDLPGGPYDVDDYESMMFKARLPGGGARVAADPEEEARLPLDWREMQDPDTGEVREVRVRLGDRVPVQIKERDFVEGKVSVRLAGSLG